MSKSRPHPPATSRRTSAGNDGIKVVTTLEFPAGTSWADVLQYLETFDLMVHVALVEEGWRA